MKKLLLTILASLLIFILGCLILDEAKIKTSKVLSECSTMYEALSDTDKGEHARFWRSHSIVDIETAHRLYEECIHLPEFADTDKVGIIYGNIASSTDYFYFLSQERIFYKQRLLANANNRADFTREELIQMAFKMRQVGYLPFDINPYADYAL